MANEGLNIWNRALAMIGAPRISSTTESSSSKTLIDDHWAGERQAFCCTHPWDGCTTIANLVANTTATIPDRYSNAYTLPADFLQAWKLNGFTLGADPSPVHEIINLPAESPPINVLLCDHTAAKLEYSFDLDTDAALALLNPTATKALVAQLAAVLSRPWGKKESDVALLERQAESLLSKAMFSNGKQQKRKAQRDRPLVDARTRRL